MKNKKCLKKFYVIVVFFIIINNIFAQEEIPPDPGFEIKIVNNVDQPIFLPSLVFPDLVCLSRGSSPTTT